MKYPKMNAKVKKAWVKALRSGDYVQTQNVLKGELSDAQKEIHGKKYGHCCLGVLSEVAVGKPLRADGAGMPPEKVAKLCDLPGMVQGAFYDKWHPFAVLADKNDNVGWSFKKIAAWVEKYL